MLNSLLRWTVKFIQRSIEEEKVPMQIKNITVAVAFISLPVAAQTTPKYKQLLAMDLGEMLKVEVATGTDKQLSEVPAVVSVITAEDIEAMGARTLAEAIERVPGLHVGASLNRLTTLFSVRGIFTDSTPQILVLIDGVDVSEMTAQSLPYTFTYPINAVERIEIIRGPGSAVYGADAFSGVINIITKTPTNENSTTVGQKLGSFDYTETWMNANLAFDDIKLSLSFTHEEQNNDNDRRTQWGIVERAREMDNIHLNLEYGEFSFKNWYWKSRQLMGTGAGIWGNDYDRDISETFKTHLSWNGSLSENIEGTFETSYDQSRFDAAFTLFPAGVWPVGADGNIFQPPFTPVTFPEGVIGRPQGETQKLNFHGAMIYSGVANHRIRMGIGLENAELTDNQELKNFGPGILDEANIPADFVSNELIDVTGTPFIYTPQYDRDLWYLSLQDEWKFADKWELTAGVRYDDYSDFGSTTNPRFALVWNSTETLTSKVLYGTAFRAPKVAELAFINNPTTLGNPDLVPEEIQTLELAFDYRPNKQLNGLLNIFTYESEDLIQLDQTFVYQNIGAQDGYGVEIEVNWQATDKLRVNANASWLETEINQSGVDKERVPHFMSFIDIRYQVHPDWLLTTQSYWIADRMREPGDARATADDYLKTDVTLLWRTDSPWQVKIGVKNLFDEDIVEPVANSPLFGLGLGFPGDYPMESRNLYGAVSYSF
ncbi:MAG: TonB-dependent receptor [Alteromonadaceae bacterium]|nr:TonB-dependent receptor [Alteromonadaceae bacterium]